MTTMFANEAADAVHQVIMLGGETRHAVEYMQSQLQAAYNMGTESPSLNALKPAQVATDTPAAPVGPAPASSTVSTPVAENPAEILNELETFVASNKTKKGSK